MTRLKALQLKYLSSKTEELEFEIFFNEEHSGLIGIKLTRQHSTLTRDLDDEWFLPTVCVSGFLKCFMRQEFSLC